MKRVLFAVILISLSSTVLAQGKGHFGISAGVNFASMTEKVEGISVTMDSRVGFKGYAFYDLQLSNLFSLQNELGYDGFGFKLSDPNSSLKLNAQINYLTLSVLPKINVNQTGLGFFAGPSFAFLLNGSMSDENGHSESNTSDYNSLDVFGVVGAEYYFPMGFGISARYMGGLTNIAKGAEDGITAHNSAFSVTFAYKFNYSK